MKFAGIIASQDSSFDVIYAYSGFIGQFGERLYEDITATAGDTSDFLAGPLTVMQQNGKQLALPMQSEMEIFIYDKEYFEAAGIDRRHPRRAGLDFYEFADKLHVENRYGGLAGLTAPFLALLYYEIYLNSTPTKLLSDDRTQIEFDNEDGLAALKAIEDGWKTQFFDPSGLTGAADYDSALLFNQGLTASQINFAELWAQAVSRATSTSSKRRSSQRSSA